MKDKEKRIISFFPYQIVDFLSTSLPAAIFAT